MTDTFIIRSDEIFLKGGNRTMFENRLLASVRDRLAAVGGFSCRRDQGVIYAAAKEPLDADTERRALDALGTIFGIAAIDCATRIGTELSAITDAAVAAYHAAGGGTFRVSARRTHKLYPLTSQDIAVAVGAAVVERAPGATVNLTAHDTDIAVLVMPDRAYVSARRVPGVGGLPGGSSGVAVALLSGGIDSPVAAWKMMRRGCALELVHFHGYPYVDRASVEKTERLAAVLARWQPGMRLHLVPLADIQRAIVAHCSDAYRVILYRRAMVRLAERVAHTHGGKAIITGDAVGQVASQTLDNLATVTAAASMPILRPLAGDDKNAIITVARAIGTYDIAIEPHDDCCSLFMPQRPATTSTTSSADAQEALIPNYAALIDDAVARTEVVVLGDGVPVLPTDRQTTTQHDTLEA